MVRIHSTNNGLLDADKMRAKIVGAVKSAMNGPGGFTATARETLRDQDQLVTGQLRRATLGEVEVDGDRVLGIVRTEKYGLFVEYGTKPHWPPFLPILRWVAQRGIGREFGEARIKDGVLGRDKLTSHWKTALNMTFDRAQSLVDAHPEGVRTFSGPARIKNGVLGRSSSMTITSQLKAARLRLTLGAEDGKFAMVSRAFMGKAMNASERAQRSVAFLIQRKISRYGTRAKPFIQPGIDAAWSKLRPALTEILRGEGRQI